MRESALLLTLVMLLACGGIWADGMKQAGVETIEQLHVLVAECDGPGKSGMLDAIETAKSKARAGDVGFSEMTALDTIVRDAAADGTIETAEKAALEQLVRSL